MTGAPRRKHKPARGVLMVLASLLCMSGAIRFGLGVQEARARVPEAQPVSAATSPATCPETPLELINALKNREDRVSTREAAVAARLTDLAEAEQQIAARLADLRAAEAALSETLARSDGAAEADLARLTAVYEAMKPKDAGALFEAMAPDFAAGFLGRMRPDSAAAVLSGMTPEAAYTVSVILAGRNTNVPKE